MTTARGKSTTTPREHCGRRTNSTSTAQNSVSLKLQIITLLLNISYQYVHQITLRSHFRYILNVSNLYSEVDTQVLQL